MSNENKDLLKQEVSHDDVIKNALENFLKETAKFKMLAKSASKKDLTRAVINALHQDLTSVTQSSVHEGQGRLSASLQSMYNTRIILLNEVITKMEKEGSNGSNGENSESSRVSEEVERANSER
jgi:hypothetical protein